jgi:hypothetical protein
MLDFTEPFLLQLGVVQDGADNVSTVNRRVRVHGTDEDLELRINASALIGISTDNGEGTDTFTIETHVLGKGLGQDDLVTFRDELAESISIASTVTGGKTLVGHIKESKVLTFLQK